MWNQWAKRVMAASLVAGLAGAANIAASASVAAQAAGWPGTPVTSTGAPPLPMGTLRAAPPAQNTPALQLPTGTAPIVRTLLAARSAQRWGGVRAKGQEITTPIDNGPQSGRYRSSVPFVSVVSPGNWSWKSRQETFLQQGDRLYSFYGSHALIASGTPEAASPYQYSFAMFPDEEYMLVQLMLSVRAQPDGAGRVAGQRVLWLAFVRGASRLKVAVDVATKQILAVQGLVGQVGNNPPAQIDDRVTSYAATGAAAVAPSKGAPVRSPSGAKGDGIRVFSSFREAQMSAPFSVVAPTLRHTDLLWSLGLAGGQLQAVIMTPTGEATVSEAEGYPVSGWGFSAVGSKGIASGAASAGAGFGAYGRFGRTGIVISTYENGSLGGDSTPSLAAWVHRFPVTLQTPIDWGAYAYTVPIYAGAPEGGRGSQAKVGSDVYWYEPANPAAGSHGRGVLYVTRHARPGQNLQSGAQPLAVLPHKLSGQIDEVLASGHDVAALVRLGNIWTVVEAGAGRAYRWTFAAAPGSVPTYLTAVHGGFSFVTPKGKYRVSWGASVALLAAAAPASAATTSPSFNPVVAQAMTYVGARTELPLQAPTFIGHANGAQHGYLAATASASSSGYLVSLQVSTTPVGLNSPALYQPPNGGLAAVISGFGAQRVSSSNAAAQAVAMKMKPVSFAGVNQQLVKYADVSLGNGIQGLYAYVPRPYSGVVEWREGEWTFRIVGSYFPADRSLAESIVAYLHAHLLPETHGLLTVNNAGDGQHTSLSWAFGNVIYTAWDYHHALSAVRMAMSMQPYSMQRYSKPQSVLFPGVIQGTMNSLKGQTTAPLQAPQNLGLPSARAQLARSSAQFGHDYYQVNLQYGNGQGMANQIGSFGAKVFGVQPTALAFLSQSAQAPHFAALRWHTISLGNGISGKLYNQVGMVRWREGLWTFNVQAGSDAADIALAGRMVGYLHTHLLPETHGSVTVKNTPEAQFSQLYWVWGNVLYHVYSVHSAMQGLEMAVSYAAF